jgi:hypothetical protein
MPFCSLTSSYIITNLDGHSASNVMSCILIGYRLSRDVARKAYLSIGGMIALSSAQPSRSFLSGSFVIPRTVFLTFLPRLTLLVLPQVFIDHFGNGRRTSFPKRSHRPSTHKGYFRIGSTTLTIAAITAFAAFQNCKKPLERDALSLKCF